MVIAGSEDITPEIVSVPQGKVGEGTEIEKGVETEIGPTENTKTGVIGDVTTPGTDVTEEDQGIHTDPVVQTSIIRIGEPSTRNMTRKPRKRRHLLLKVPPLNPPQVDNLSPLDQTGALQGQGHTHRPD